ncbi:hypothetical protein A3K73_04655 [Candidatus Pacearchaeota archaeon RBG_13_36_9]|nr:MAG: hypothetical protein A3K73_04655 [Candidatus Pacearchaeota archaeon RBG_13_36_9]
MEDSVSKIIEEVSPFYGDAKKYKREPVEAEKHELTYDSTSETLEPVYFWIVDYMNSLFERDVKKLIDNFSSSPGSGHFSELGMRATRMQEEGMKILGAVNTVLKSILNLIYDLKEFEIRISHYTSANSKNKDEAEAGFLALKQIWMDNVDVKRGRGSINMMAQDLNFVTLRDAFMIARSVGEVEKMDLNDRVKRILKPRLKEFFEWKTRSEIELKKRFEIEKSYLKSQLNSLQLYTRWAKPYLIAAERLRMQEMGQAPDLVNVFNTIVLQLTLFAKEEIKIDELVLDSDVPREFGKKGRFKRKYYKCVLVDFVFRGIPQRVSGQQAHYVFGGRTDVSFRGYCLNEDELKLFDEGLKKSDIEDALKLVEGVTTESLDQLKGDIDYFLKSDAEKAKEEEKKRKSIDINPFSALFGFYSEKVAQRKENKEKAHLEKLKKKGAAGDNYAEKLIRNIGEGKAAESCFNIFDTYKKAHGMPSHPAPEEEYKKSFGEF